MELTITNIKGEDTGRKTRLPAEIFGVEPNEHVVYLEVKRYLASQRQGTHKTKERSEITGSRKKLRRQKGTGMARVGDIKSPIFRGGGRVFGPQPRDYGFKVNKKEKLLARKSALSQKAADQEIRVLEDFAMEEPKTSRFAEILSTLDASYGKALFIVAEKDHNLRLSSRNIPNALIRTGNEVTTYELLDNKQVFITESGLKQLTENLMPNKS